MPQHDVIPEWLHGISDADLALLEDMALDINFFGDRWSRYGRTADRNYMLSAIHTMSQQAQIFQRRDERRRTEKMLAQTTNESKDSDE